jgi:hypothetical protein
MAADPTTVTFLDKEGEALESSSTCSEGHGGRWASHTSWFVQFPDREAMSLAAGRVTKTGSLGVEFPKELVLAITTTL